MLNRAKTILFSFLVPFFFSGCLAEVASVASLASSFYTLKDMVIDEKIENAEQNSQEKILKAEQKSSQNIELIIERVEEIEERNDIYLSKEEKSSPIQTYYAYPTIDY